MTGARPGVDDALVVDAVRERRLDSLTSSPAGIAREAGRKRLRAPRVHLLRKKMDCRVKPGNDSNTCRSPP
jgi:hypothetical protein